MKKKEKLLIDKKECTNCGHILEKDIKVCDECGYDMTMEESLKIYLKKFVKILNEQTAPLNINLNKKDGKYTKQTPQVPIDPKTLKPGVYQLNVNADEGEDYKYDLKNKSLSKTSPVSMDNLKSGDKITVSDEGRKKKVKNKKPNPWAICTASVGRDDMKKYEKCVMDVKKQHKMDEDLQRLEEYIERLIMDSEVNPKIKKGNFKQFVSKLK